MRILLIIFALFTFNAKADYLLQIVDLQHKETKEMTRILYLAGDIDEGISTDTKYLLDKYDVDRAVLYSAGGYAAEGYKLGWLFSDKLINTYVARETYCLSACAIAFIGGTNYEINNGILGFHKGHLNGAEPFKNQDEAFDAAQQSGSYSLAYILNNGFSYYLDRNINDLTSPNKFLSFTSAEELNNYFVRDDENKLSTYFEEMNKHLQENPTKITYDIIQIVEKKEHKNDTTK